jgi:hypothetical protein
LPPEPVEPKQSKHPIVADRFEALDLDEESLPGLPKRVPKLRESLVPPIGGFHIGENPRGSELAGGRDVVQQPLKISRFHASYACRTSPTFSSDIA